MGALIGGDAGHQPTGDKSLERVAERPWRKIPEQVLRGILRELGHPRPDNLTR